MRDILRAEWVRATTTRGLPVMVAVTALVTALGTFSTTSATTQVPWHLTEPLRDSFAWVLAAVNGSFLALLVGARPVTEEVRHGTFTHTLLADPRRIRGLVAKAAAAAAMGGAVGLVVASTVVAVSLAMAVTTGGVVSLDPGDARAAAGLVMALALWGVIGAGVAMVVRSRVVVAVGGLLWVLVFENLGAGLLGSVGAYLPGPTTQALARTREAVALLAPIPAGLVMGIVTLGVLLVGVAAIGRAEWR